MAFLFGVVAKAIDEAISHTLLKTRRSALSLLIGCLAWGTVCLLFDLNGCPWWYGPIAMYAVAILMFLAGTALLKQ